MGSIKNREIVTAPSGHATVAASLLEILDENGIVLRDKQRIIVGELVSLLAEFKDRAKAPAHLLSNVKWSVDGRYVHRYRQEYDDTRLGPVSKAVVEKEPPPDRPAIQFYWIARQASLTVSVTAIIETPDGRKMPASGSAFFEVVGPESVKLAMQNDGVEIRDAAPKTPHIVLRDLELTYAASVPVPGSFSIVPLISSYEEVEMSDGNVFYAWTLKGGELTRVRQHHVREALGDESVSAPRRARFNFFSAPWPSRDHVRVTIQQKLRFDLMYMSDAKDSIWVTLATVAMSWRAESKKNRWSVPDDLWEIVSADIPRSASGAVTSELPVWEITEEERDKFKRKDLFPP